MRRAKSACRVHAAWRSGRGLARKRCIRCGKVAWWIVMAETPEDRIQEWVAAFVQEVAAAREKACEAALQSGGYGVLETHNEDGSVTFTLTTKVPYGQIHERRAESEGSS